MTWRAKFIFLLIVYFAGFATAIYALAPAGPSNAAEKPIAAEHRETGPKAVSLPDFNSEEFARSVKTAMQKCLRFSKDAAIRTGTLIKEKIDQRRHPADS